MYNKQDYFKMVRRPNIRTYQTQGSLAIKTECYVKTIQEAIDQYLDKCKYDGLSEFTVKNYRECLNALTNILARQNIDLDTGSITAVVLENNFRRYMVDKQYKPETINGRIRVVKRFYNWSYEKGLIPHNPAVSLTKVKSNPTVIETFSEEQVNALLSAPNTNTFTGYRDYVMMVLLLDCGIRLKGLSELTIRNLDLKTGYITIPNEKNKSRQVPISEETCDLLKVYLADRRRISGVDNVFVTLDCKPMARRSIEDMIEKYGKLAHIIGVRVSPHTFRHTFAKLYLLDGGDFVSLQNILGHSSMDMVRRYVNLWGTEVKKQHTKFSPLNHFKVKLPSHK